MKTRLPLFARILGWFFLNLLILGVAAAMFVGIQVQSGAEVLVSTLAGERLQSIAKLLRDEIASRPRPEWNGIVARFGSAYRAKIYFFRPDGEMLAGPAASVPAEVKQRLNDPRRPRREGAPELGFDPPPGFQPDRPPEFDGPPEDRRGRPGRGAPAIVRFVVRTDAPKTYWIGLPVPGEPGGRFPGTVVMESNTLNVGGLVLDTWAWVWAILAAAFFSALFWLPLVRNITGAVKRMRHATAQIAEGKFDVRVNSRRSDELGDLGNSINQMATRLDGFVTGQKRFLGDIAHELCSPVARMQMALGILEERASGRDAEYVQDVKEEVQHMSNLVNELLSFSKASLGAKNIRLQSVELHSVVERAMRREETEGVQMRNEVAPELLATADPELLVRALSNLLRNGVRYAGDAGPITVSAQRVNGHIELRVADEGPGVPETELPKLFDPFYRVDLSRARETGGVGLGLAIVKTCVDSCGGTVSCQNRQPTGLEVIIRLPAAKAEVVTETAAVA